MREDFALKTRWIRTAALLAVAAPAFAHDGHGLFGPHWHASDTVGLLLVCGFVALALWLALGGKK
ncbi:MAG TPA: hypothetical protein VLJ86_22340 [Ramlibacter sp.]|nr:hypothetical protein [Ramlibacter sp.]